MIEFAAVSGLVLVLVALVRSCWRALWWSARFEATMAREMPATRWPGPGEVPLGVVARRAVNVQPPAAARELGGFYFDPR